MKNTTQNVTSQSLVDAYRKFEGINASIFTAEEQVKRGEKVMCV
jgi:hypothetical protein